MKLEILKPNAAVDTAALLRIREVPGSNLALRSTDPTSVIYRLYASAFKQILGSCIKTRRLPSR